MKVIIPVAGAGAKLRPFTYTQPKCLIPLAGKTILSFIVDELIEAGADDFIFIIGHLGEKIKDYVIEKYPQINAQFVVQLERDGTGHAVFLAKDLVAENEEIVIVFGDTICDNQIKNIVDNPHSCFGIKKVDDPRNFGVVELDHNGKALHVIEKPTVPKSNMALVGIYKIKESKLLFAILNDGIAKNILSEKYQLTNAIDSMIQKNVQFDTFIVENWYDCGKKESLLNTNANILKKLEFASDEVPFFDNTIIIHPVSIADGCNIQNSIIGPNVTIGENATIESSIISDSIIGSYSELNKVVLHKSLIGSDAFVKGYSQSLNIGDNTEIDLQ
jgi:glucose-1-phosphate thymidylyltransferase